MFANPEHAKILREGVKVWNKWRKKNVRLIFYGPELHSIDFEGQDLKNIDLSRANLYFAYLKGTDLRGADLREADLRRADLSGADLRGATLSGANLDSADLSHADLRDAEFGEVEHELQNDERGSRRIMFLKPDLRSSNLTETKLNNADLSSINFTSAILTKTDFTGSIIRSAIFGNNDLSRAIGLDAIRHDGPSTIGIDTIYKSSGMIPEVFLRGCGLPDNFIAYIGSLVGRPIEYYSCFISYSSKNHAFAERLYADLQSSGVRCWYAPEDMKIGDRIRIRIDETIRLRDKLLLVLSKESVESQWVEKEVETAMEREGNRKETVLVPITLDDAVTAEESGWAADIRRTRHIGDFRKWKDHDAYQKAFQRLLRDLKAETAKP